MAIDTVKLESPPVPEGVATQVERACVTRLGIQNATGEVLYRLTTGGLDGSYDSRLAVRVLRERWAEGSPPRRVACAPYVEVEGSLHKWLAGHNVWGGPTSFQAAVRAVLDKLSEMLGVEWPDASEWLVRRVDVAEVFDLGSYEAVEQYVRGLNQARYPRRTVMRYGSQGLYAAGYSSTLKVYHKGPEFARHDRSRLLRVWSPEQVSEMQVFADRLLRVEVEVKRRLRELDPVNQWPRVDMVADEWLQEQYEVEVARLLHEGADEVKVVRTAEEVQARLTEVYGGRLAGVLLGTWYLLATLGEDRVLEQIRRGEEAKRRNGRPVGQAMSRATFYRHRKMLQDAGCAWHGTDVVLRKVSLIPEGFTPSLRDPRRVTGEAPEVRAALAPYRAA